MFVIVVKSSEDDVVISTFPKDWLVGLTLICDTPVALTENDCGDPVALSVTVKVADSGPIKLGFAVKLITQVAPAASELPQSPPEGLVVKAKSPEFTPLKAIAVIVSDAEEAVQAPPVEILPLHSVTV